MYEQFQNPVVIKGLATLSADDNLILESVNMKVGAYTLDAQPYMPSKLGFKATAGDTADTMGTIAVVGSLFGVVQSETVTPVAGSTVWTTKYYDAVTTLTGVDWVIDAVDGTEDTIIVGVSAESSIPVKGRNISFVNVSGNIWVSNLDTAVADITSLLLTAGMYINWKVKGNLSVITDVNGGTCQYVIYQP